MATEPSRYPIFLRHPITGIVTKHRHPYPTFPSIRLRTADPAFVTMRAFTQLSSSGPAPELLRKCTRALMSFHSKPPTGWFASSGWHPEPKPPLIRAPFANPAPSSAGRTLPAASTRRTADAALPLSRKRQRQAATSEECPPHERSRAIPSIPLRRDPLRAAKTKGREDIAPPACRRRVP